MGKIIALCNQKGGVGKTAATINLGAALSEMGLRVLLVDTDPQSHTTKGLGWNNPSVIKTALYEQMKAVIDGKNYEIEDTVLHHEEGMDILPNNIKSSMLEQELIPVIAREQILKRALAQHKEVYDYILIDCPPSLGLITMNALTAADSVIIPTEPSYLGLDGMDMLFTTIANVRNFANQNLDVEGILISKKDSRTNEAKEDAAVIHEIYGNVYKVFNIEIPEEVKVREAVKNGKSSLKYNTRGKASEAFRSLAREVVEDERN